MNALNSPTQCSMCGNPPVITRSYSGEILCRDCFRESILSKVRQAISKWDMLQRTDRIAVALSGGKDSAVLLSILVEVQRKFPESEVLAMTLNEGKAEDNERLQIVTKMVGQLGVEHVISSYKEIFSTTLDEIVERACEEKSSLAPCAFCGVLRRQGLNFIARKTEADKLALGHNLDDEVQSMLMNLIRGDLQRLSRLTPIQSGTHPSLIPRIKPLYHILENELQLYADLSKLPYQINPCSYREQSLRQEIRAWLNEFEIRHSGSKYNLYATFSRIIGHLPHQREEDFRICQKCGEATSRDICAPCELLNQLNLEPSGRR